eukprot:gene4726-8310_t
MNRALQTLLLLSFIMIIRSKNFVIFSRFTERECNYSKPHYGVIYPFNRCIMNRSIAEYLPLNNTHFTVRSYCSDMTCESCHYTSQSKYQCNRSLSSSYSTGPIPKIKEKGFFSRVYSDSNCLKDDGKTNFVTDKYCSNFGTIQTPFPKITKHSGKSETSFYDVQTKQVIAQTFKELDCKGEILTDSRVPLNECMYSGWGYYFKAFKE